MADQQWTQELSDVEDAATEQALQQHQQEQRAQQEEVPTEPATSPRTIDPPVQEWHLKHNVQTTNSQQVTGVKPFHLL